MLRLERRITRDGMASIDGNLYSVPNSARRRTVEGDSTANEVRIPEDGAAIATYPVLDGRGQRRIIAGHRTLLLLANSETRAMIDLDAVVPVTSSRCGSGVL